MKFALHKTTRCNFTWEVIEDVISQQYSTVQKMVRMTKLTLTRDKCFGSSYGLMLGAGVYLRGHEVRELREQVPHVAQRGLDARQLRVARLHVPQQPPRLRRLSLHVVHEQRDVLRVQQCLALLVRYRQVRWNIARAQVSEAVSRCAAHGMSQCEKCYFGRARQRSRRCTSIDPAQAQIHPRIKPMQSFNWPPNSTVLRTSTIRSCFLTKLIIMCCLYCVPLI